MSNDDSKIVKDMFDYYNNNNVSLRNTAIYINKNYNKNNITYLNFRNKMRNNGCYCLDTIRVSNIEPYFEDLIQRKLNILSKEKIHREGQYLKDMNDYKSS